MVPLPQSGFQWGGPGARCSESAQLSCRVVLPLGEPRAVCARTPLDHLLSISSVSAECKIILESFWRAGEKMERIYSRHEVMAVKGKGRSSYQQKMWFICPVTWGLRVSTGWTVDS